MYNDSGLFITGNFIVFLRMTTPLRRRTCGDLINSRLKNGIFDYFIDAKVLNVYSGSLTTYLSEYSLFLE